MVIIHTGEEDIQLGPHAVCPRKGERLLLVRGAAHPDVAPLGDYRVLDVEHQLELMTGLNEMHTHVYLERV